LTNRDVVPDGAFYSPVSPLARYYVYTSRGQVTRYVHHGSPAAADAFAALGIDLATMSNNHSLDQGPEGLTDTIENLDAAGIRAIGAGVNSQAALAPYVVETKFGRVAIFSFGEEGGTAPNALAGSAGILALTEANVAAARELATAQGIKWTVASVHWGNNYEDVLPEQEAWARRLARAGFDLVVGSGPHIVQPFATVNGTPVLYSVGNFVFNSPGRFTDGAPGFGLAATTVLGPRGFREIRLTCLVVDNKIVNYQPTRCDAATSAKVLTSLSDHLEMEGDVGVVKW